MLIWERRRLKSSSPETRLAAARALGQAKEKKAVPDLIRALNDQDPQVQTAAAQALSAIPHPAAVEPLVAVLARRPERTLAEAAAAMGPPAAPALAALLQAEDKGARRWAAYALGLIREPQAAAALAACLQDKRSEVRQEAAAALGRIGGSQSVGALIAAIGHRDAETRKSVIEALGISGDEAALPLLTAQTEDRDEAVQLAAVGALGRIGGIRAAVGLRAACESERKQVRDAALRALKSITLTSASPEDKATLAVLVGDFEEALRQGQAAIAPLLQVLSSRDSGRRSRAVQCLAKLGTDTTVQALLGALRHPAPEARDCAVQALVVIGMAALKPLHAMLSRPGPETHLLAARASVEALGGILERHANYLPLDDLGLIAELPDPVIHDRDGLTETIIDCSTARDCAHQELLRRAQSSNPL